MELRSLLRIASRRWKSILVVTLVAIGFGGFLVSTATPTYSSHARLFVASPKSDSSEAYQGSLFSAQRVESYADLASSHELSTRVVERLELEPGTEDELSQRITAGVRPDTVVIAVSVTDANPEEARRLTQAVAVELTQLIAELEAPLGNRRAPIRATIVGAATLPTSPDSPQPVRYLGIAATCGLLLALVIAVTREVLDTSVKAQEETPDAA